MNLLPLNYLIHTPPSAVYYAMVVITTKYSFRCYRGVRQPYGDNLLDIRSAINSRILFYRVMGARQHAFNTCHENR